MIKFLMEVKLAKEFATLFEQYETLIKAVVEVFHPFVEVAVHDLESGKVAAIYHNISQRKVGEPSPLKELKVNIEDFPDYFSPYYKQNWDGRALKCTSITMRNKKGKPVGLICFNIDVAFLQDGYQLFKTFLQVKDEAENPVETFGSDSEEQMDGVIKDYLEVKNISLKHMNRAQKKELVQHLYRKGIFNFKNAVPFMAKKLNTSRASIYNYIKQIGE
jgi:predicted transcriptional regulator YheO